VNGSRGYNIETECQKIGTIKEAKARRFGGQRRQKKVIRLSYFPISIS